MDALVRDCHAALGALHGGELTGPVAESGELLALLAGQDVEQARTACSGSPVGVARGRVIPTVQGQTV